MQKKTRSRRRKEAEGSAVREEIRGEYKQTIEVSKHKEKEHKKGGLLGKGGPRCIKTQEGRQSREMEELEKEAGE